jgi:hypothetical protein
VEPEKVKLQVKQKLKEKADKLTPEQKKALRQQMVAGTLSTKSANRDANAEKEKEKKPEPVLSASEKVRQLALEMRDRVNFLAEPQGAYASAWRRHEAKDGSHIHLHMGHLSKHLVHAQDLTEKVLGHHEVPEDLMTQFHHMLEKFDTEAMSLVRQVDTAMREDESANKKEDGGDFGDALQVLDGLEGLCKAEDWKEAVEHAGKARGKVVGGPTAIARIGGLVKRYVSLWDSLGTDGLKGASYEGLKKLSDCRMEMVSAVAESGEPLLMACCRPETKFYDYVKSLAGQSCSSRDVQAFQGWWEKNHSVVN